MLTNNEKDSVQISDKQLAANRQNALSSTGPKSVEGRKKISSNALTHGLTAKKHLIIGESEDEFETFKSGLLDELNPDTALLEETASQLLSLAWRLRRVPVVEAAIYTLKVESIKSFEETRKIFETSFDKKKETNQDPNFKNAKNLGQAFAYACGDSNLILKLNVYEQRLFNKYYNLLDIYRKMIDENKSKSNKSTEVIQ
jgi:hypothetical protein